MEIRYLPLVASYHWCLSFSLSASMYVFLCISLCLPPLSLFLSICLPVCVFICLPLSCFFSLSNCFSVCFSLCLPHCVFLFLFIGLSAFVCFSVCLSLSTSPIPTLNILPIPCNNSWLYTLRFEMTTFNQILYIHQLILLGSNVMIALTDDTLFVLFILSLS